MMKPPAERHVVQCECTVCGRGFAAVVAGTTKPASVCGQRCREERRRLAANARSARVRAAQGVMHEALVTIAELPAGAGAAEIAETALRKAR